MSGVASFRIDLTCHFCKQLAVFSATSPRLRRPVNTTGITYQTVFDADVQRLVIHAFSTPVQKILFYKITALLYQFLFKADNLDNLHRAILAWGFFNFGYFFPVLPRLTSALLSTRHIHQPLHSSPCHGPALLNRPPRRLVALGWVRSAYPGRHSVVSEARCTMQADI